ncbi:neutral zinc metallopeptidase [Nocardiopsis sp. EMB25]|uniref:neutral zinc metallopeptidase n=1 Tax=Nocardiopsis TaxID=2013 RepID=UPI00034D0F62|nr:MULTISPECIES: neutral zinc metallopeptidase [Nocardiopsis]MCY9784466.1 neutral zinc metallopeptidase [Nocardiopsis sp. EMB25]
MLFGTSVAAAVALAALAASVVTVVNTPREDPSAGGADLGAYYDTALVAAPNPVEVDLVDHPLYAVATPTAVECDTPELDMDSDESWEEFANATGTCLDALWNPVMDELGLSPETPEITVTLESPDSGDEEGYTLAYYEGDYTRITVVLPNVRELGAFIPAEDQEEVWVALMGHEYGHHVQFATGILDLSYDMRVKAEDENEELDALRRTELQAECMAGVGLRAIMDGDADALDVVDEHFNSGGDLDTHGSAVNRSFWLEEGWSRGTVEGCNTYGADEDRVS